MDLHSGNVRWRLGGEHSSFKLGPGTRTYWQHDAKWQPGGLISVFDNGSDPPMEKQSRGLLLDPNLATHTVTLVKQFVNPTETLLASSQGNLLSLPGGNWLMGYGGLPNFTEYDSSGHVLLDGTLGKSVQDFRTYFFALERAADERAVGARYAGRRRHDRGRGELERGDRSRLLARARGRLAERARPGGHRRQDGLSDDDRDARHRPLRCGPGARLLGHGHRHLGDGQGLSAWPARRLRRARSARWTGLAGGAGAFVGLVALPSAHRRGPEPDSAQLRAPDAERLRGAGRRTRDGISRTGNAGTPPPPPRSACSGSPRASWRTSSSRARARVCTPGACSRTRRATERASCRREPSTKVSS